MDKRKRTIFLKALTLVGCFSTGIIYAAIGSIAILSFLKLKEGGADESSFFVLLDGFTAGRMLNWIIILGAVCFIIWRFYEAVKDPYQVGSGAKGILLRLGTGLSSFADAFIVLSVFQALFNQQKAPATGEPIQQRAKIEELLEMDWGKTIVLVVGAVVMLTALVLVFYGLSKRFTEALDSTKFSKWQQYILHAIAYAGYLSRGIILGIIGFFLFKAALEKDSSNVVNTDKAFDFIGDQVGHIFYIAVAAGTICYGVYMFVLGLNYDINSDKKK
ncbi:MAG TPA: DUF1206 domain-containing protein [Chitinophagaceae bacterium]|nr:DUF1206 domain-containing protein [Chitinophagaceae bacterium]